MTKKLAKAYKMLKTCFIKIGNIHVIEEEFEAGKIYAAKDIIDATAPLPEIRRKDGSIKQEAGPDDRRLRVWIDMGFCIPAGDGAKTATVATPEQKADAKQEADEKRQKQAADEAAKKAKTEAKKLEAETLKTDAKAAKEEAAKAKKLAAEDKKKRQAADKDAAAQLALQEKEEKAEAKAIENWAKLWKDVPAEDYPKYVALLNEQGYEFEEDVPAPDEPEAWLEYFVPFFGEDGPPELYASFEASK